MLDYIQAQENRALWHDGERSASFPALFQGLLLGFTRVSTVKACAGAVSNLDDNGHPGTGLTLLSDYYIHYHGYSCPQSLLLVSSSLFYSTPIFLPVLRNGINPFRLHMRSNNLQCEASLL